MIRQSCCPKSVKGNSSVFSNICIISKQIFRAALLSLTLFCRIYDTDLMSLGDWVSLLGVSTKLLFLKFRKRAVVEISAQIEAVGAVEAVVLANRYDVPEWYGPAYRELCRRPTPLDEFEAEQLVARSTARIGRAREMIREEAFGAFTQRRYGSRYNSPETFDDDLVTRVVEDVFWPETV